MPSALSSPAFPLLQALRQGTASLHKRLEARMPFFSAGFDLPAYRHLLMAYHGFHAPLERQLAAHLPALDHARRAKTPALTQDLRALGLSPGEIDALPCCQALPEVTDEATALGVMYVLEGSTLGGQVLKRALAERLGIDHDSGGAFLDVYGTETGTLWRGFLHFLECYPASPVQQANTVRAAIDTFTCFEQWLEAREVLL
ncbi:biliverdin-producing heme oxygenase [Pseudomonas capeferrum]|uniref:biliverdin-producing heme oxygenase n=1 Tax=Pseudomonas capeferrum TaxID=1495066 RepID=UPI0015E29BA1|nr:biliverdin-producing heme oxygenase [Pseudomonas capeferrum]MBA1204536.1 biliverdin-producing heme oxygenase [Pseudomonas capeferrum]